MLGVIGLITAGYYFMNTGSGVRNVKTIVMYGLLGIIFFGAGIGLIRNTSDRPT
jgi:predicted Na+-dependent transporter